MQVHLYLCTEHKRELIGKASGRMDIVGVSADPSPQLCEERTCREPINFLVEIRLR